jgi:hypothetical protein
MAETRMVGVGSGFSISTCFIPNGDGGRYVEMELL